MACKGAPCGPALTWHHHLGEAAVIDNRGYVPQPQSYAFAMLEDHSTATLNCGRAEAELRKSSEVTARDAP